MMPLYLKPSMFLEESRFVSRFLSHRCIGHSIRHYGDINTVVSDPFSCLMVTLNVT